MTREEFSNTRWGAGMQAKYQNKTYPIGSVDFEEDLIGLEITETDEYKWVRCENCELIT